MPDPIADRVYAWEENFVDPRQPDRFKLLSSEQCRELIFTACSRSGTTVPALRFVRQSLVPCKANFRDWTITISEWGRNGLTVLHEVAHLATVKAIQAGEDGHGPAFVRQAMDLYNEFMGIDMDHMEMTATRARVAFAARNARRPARPSNGDTSPFGDLDF
jgi:hypothetical protein